MSVPARTPYSRRLTASISPTRRTSTPLGELPGSSSCTTATSSSRSATSSYRGAGTPAPRANSTFRAVSRARRSDTPGCQVSTDLWPSGQRTYAAPTCPPALRPSTVSSTPVSAASLSTNRAASSRATWGNCGSSSDMARDASTTTAAVRTNSLQHPRPSGGQGRCRRLACCHAPPGDDQSVGGVVCEQAWGRAACGAGGGALVHRVPHADRFQIPVADSCVSVWLTLLGEVQSVVLPIHVAEWALRAVAPGGRLVDVVPLPGWSDAPPSLLRIDGGRWTTYVVLRTLPVGCGRIAGYAREVQALTLAERYGIAAPRVIAADLDGSELGDPATLVTALPGYSSPTIRTVEELQAYGAAVASLRAVKAGPLDDLTLGHGPIDVDQAAAERCRALRYEAGSEHEQSVLLDAVCTETGLSRGDARARVLQPPGGRSAFLEAGEELLARIPEPHGETVLVHGDLHLGNTMWIGKHVTGMVDWDAARVGHEGIDLGLARFDAVLRVDLDPTEVAAGVLAGWEKAAGIRLDSAVVAYWDARAALNCPARFADHDQGLRRDVFLKAALRCLSS